MRAADFHQNNHLLLHQQQLLRTMHKFNATMENMAGEGGAQTHGEKTSLPGSSLHQQPAAVEVNPREADRGCTHLETDGSAVESRSERRTDGLLRARSTKSAEAQS